MTGTGTQADPYIVDNWPDFVTAAGTSGAYVEFPEGGGTIDMNSVAPEGISSTIEIRCASIEGNGWSIINLYSSGNRDVFHNYGTVYISKLNIENFYVDFQNGSVKYVFSDSSSGQQYTFDQCKFSGELRGQSGEMWRISYYYSRCRLNRCAVNVKLVGGTEIVNSGGSWDHDHNRILFGNIKVQGNSSALLGKCDMQNCLVSGKSNAERLDITSFGNTSNCNVFDVDFTGAASFSCAAPQNSLNLINSDKLPIGATIGTGFTGVTTAQLSNAAYLASLGFPIAEE